MKLAGEIVLPERERWLLWAPVCLALGVAGYFLLPMEPPNWLGSVWAGMSFALAYVSRRRTGLVLLFLAIAIVGCGMAAGQIMYYLGMGIPANNVITYMWLSLAKA